MKSRAFTLVELSLVLTIAGILAGAVALRLGGPLHRARMADALGAVHDFDLATRSAAQSQDRPFRLAIDPANGQLTRRDEKGRPCGSPPLALPVSCRIERLTLGGPDGPGRDLTIRCSSRGLTPTYAFLLHAEERKQWVVVVGLTGQQLLVDNEREVNDILAAGTGNLPH